jgi:hypothetical protein
MLVLGLGIGMTIPTITLAVQNAVDWTDLGVASSAVTFIGSLGGAIGLAAYGAVFSNRVQTLPADVAAVVESPEEIRRLAEPLPSQVVDTLAYAIRGVFLFAIPVVAIAWVASFFLKEIPLRSSSPLERRKVETGADEEAASIEAASAIV